MTRPILNKAQQARFVALIKRAAALQPVLVTCMLCGRDLPEVGRTEDGDAVYAPCGCGQAERSGNRGGRSTGRWCSGSTTDCRSVSGGSTPLRPARVKIGRWHSWKRACLTRRKSEVRFLLGRPARVVKSADTLA